MAVTSEVDIMNSALIKLGAERIVSADDANNRARLLKEQYPKRRDVILRSHPWKFAIKRASLALISPKPSNYDDYDSVFQLPADNMRVIEILNQSTYLRWDTENNIYLLADASEITIRYIFRQTDVTQYDDNFCEVLAWDLAADIAYALTQSSAQVQMAAAGLKQAIMEARSFNGQQGSVKRVQAEEFVDSRFY
jgi:hypothetical protein